jgi:hypothetical protein
MTEGADLYIDLMQAPGGEPMRNAERALLGLEWARHIVAFVFCLTKPGVMLRYPRLCSIEGMHIVPHNHRYRYLL